MKSPEFRSKVLALSLITTLGLSACGDAKKSVTEETATTPVPKIETPTQPSSQEVKISRYLGKQAAIFGRRALIHRVDARTIIKDRSVKDGYKVNFRRDIKDEANANTKTVVRFSVSMHAQEGNFDPDGKGVYSVLAQETYCDPDGCDKDNLGELTKNGQGDWTLKSDDMGIIEAAGDVERQITLRDMRQTLAETLRG